MNELQLNWLNIASSSPSQLVINIQQNKVSVTDGLFNFFSTTIYNYFTFTFKSPQPIPDSIA